MGKFVPLFLRLFLLMLIGFLAVAASAQLTHTTYSSSINFTTSFYALAGGIPDKSSPTMADLTGDGVPEVIVGTTAYNGANGRYDRPNVLVAMRGDGTTLWSRDLGAPINSAASVGDLNRDGQPDVVVGVGADVADMRRPGGVVALDRNGNQLWRFNTLDHYPVDGFAEGVYGTPTLCDVDGDGTLEVAFGSWDQRIYLLNSAGAVLWKNVPMGATGQGYLNADSVWSTAACADLNGDGEREIIIGADITGGGVLPDGTPTQNGGFVYVFDKDGNVLVRRFLPEAIYSSPAVGDLDRDGDLEIVTGTGWYWWDQRGRRDPSQVYVFDTHRVFDTLHYNDAAKLPNAAGWPQQTPHPGFSSPALADLDGNGDLEIVIGTGDPLVPNDRINGAGSVYAWHHTGQLVAGWPVFPKNANGDDTTVFSSPTVGDVDNDGQMEVLFSMIWDVQVYNANGSFQERLPTAWTIWGSPAIGDADGDNKMEVWIAGSKADGDPTRGYLWKFEQPGAGLGSVPWGQFHGDAAKGGQAGTSLVYDRSEVRLFREGGATGAVRGTVRVRNEGTVPAVWQASTSAGQVTVSPANGTLAPNGEAVLTVTVNAPNLGAGQHALGQINVAARVANNPVGRIEMPVYLNVGSLLFVPLANTRPAPEPDLVYWNQRTSALPEWSNLRVVSGDS